MNPEDDRARAARLLHKHIDDKGKPTSEMSADSLIGFWPTRAAFAHAVLRSLGGIEAVRAADDDIVEAILASFVILDDHERHQVAIFDEDGDSYSGGMVGRSSRTRT